MLRPLSLDEIWTEMKSQRDGHNGEKNQEMKLLNVSVQSESMWCLQSVKMLGEEEFVIRKWEL